MTAVAAAMTGAGARPATPADMAAIQRIYAHHVLTSLATFEEVPPDEAEMNRRREEIVGRGLPYLVIEREAKVVGFAYAGPYRTRSAYRYTLEDSIYVAPEVVGQGYGRALLSELLLQCTKLGFRQMIAIIGDSQNGASMRLHERLGFRRAGVLTGVGFKFGRWVDGLVMQLPLGDSDRSAPQ
jgi:phosphinothricin acetyltransferase